MEVRGPTNEFYFTRVNYLTQHLIVFMVVQIGGYMPVIIRGFLILSLVFSFVTHTAFASYPLAYVGAPDARDASLSPNGAQVAILMTAYNSSQRTWDTINIVSSETGETVKTIDTENRTYAWVLWAYDDIIITHARVYKIKRRKAKVQDVIMAINVNTGEEKILVATKKIDYRKDRTAPKLLGISYDARELAIISTKKKKVTLQIVNIDTGKAKIVAQGNEQTIRWQLGNNLIPTMRVDVGKYDHVQHYYAQDKETKEWGRVATRNLLDSDFKPVGHSDNDNHITVIARPKTANFSGLYEYNIFTGKYARSIYENQKFDLSKVAYSSYDSKLLYASWWDDKLERHWFDKTYQSRAAGLEQGLHQQDNWSILETSKDGKIWLLYVSNTQNPGGYQIWNSERKKRTVISKDRPGLSPDVLSPTHRIDYQASDGLRLFGYFTPAIKDAQNAPLIVMPHGGPVARDYQDWNGWTQYFAFRGYSIFQPQFRGSGGFGYEFTKKGHLQWGKAMQSDIEDGVIALENRGLTSLDSQRVIIGISYGGYAALMAATDTSATSYQCVVSVNGVSDVTEFLKGFDKADPIEASLLNIWTRRIGNHEQNPDALAAISPAQHADRITADLFLIHGAADEIVPVEQSRLMNTSAKKAGVNVTYTEIEGMNHNRWHPRDETDILVAINWFLTKCRD